jgi:hypothetical protein
MASYDKTKDGLSKLPKDSGLPGRKSNAYIANSSAQPLTTYARVMTTSTGNLSILPVGNADGAYIMLVNVAIFFTPPFQVRELGPLNTCNVVTIEV